MTDSTSRRPTGRGPDLSALAQITDAVQAGAGLPEVLRAAERALDASLILIDRSASVLAVAARSPADERSLMRDADDVIVDRAEGRRHDRRTPADAQRAIASPTTRCCGS